MNNAERIVVMIFMAISFVAMLVCVFLCVVNVVKYVNDAKKKRLPEMWSDKCYEWFARAVALGITFAFFLTIYKLV